MISAGSTARLTVHWISISLLEGMLIMAPWTLHWQAAVSDGSVQMLAGAGASSS